jgi:hypothetical protein
MMSANANERILELADKAIEDMPGAWNIPDEFCKKFAELIVRECYGEVQCQLYDYNPSSNEQYNAGHEAGLKLAVSKIKEHFGVEQ